MVYIGKHEIKNFEKPYFIAEIGANHNGNMELAKKTIDAAIDAGCDAVKFQSWTPTSINSKKIYEGTENEYYKDFDITGLYKFVDLMALTEENHRELFNYCEKQNVDFLSSAFSNKEIKLLEDLGVKAHKAASMDLTNLPLLKTMAETMKPVIVSTGMGTIDEIQNAVNLFKDVGNENLILLHCVAVYPPKDEYINMKNIDMLHKYFNLPIGFSDHTPDIPIPILAVSRGAAIIEKHFTIDRNMIGWDHSISVDPIDMKSIINYSIRITKANGIYNRSLSKDETDKRNVFRRSFVAKNNLKEGHIIQEEDLMLKRPGSGIGYEYLDLLVGRKLKRNLQEDELLSMDDI